MPTSPNRIPRAFDGWRGVLWGLVLVVPFWLVLVGLIYLGCWVVGLIW
jgi:hypothetical protein